MRWPPGAFTFGTRVVTAPSGVSRSIAFWSLAESSRPPAPSNSRFSSEPSPDFSVFCCQGAQAGSAALAPGTAAMKADSTIAADRPRTAASLQVPEHAGDTEGGDGEL